MPNIAFAVRNGFISAPEVGPVLRLNRRMLLYEQNTETDSLYFLETGLVKLTRTSSNGHKHILGVLGANQLIGEECLINGGSNYSSAAECLVDTTAYKIPINYIKRLYGIPDFSCSLVSYILEGKHMYSQKVEMLSGRDVEYRILIGLAELAQLVKPSADGSAYAIPMTQSEIACFIGATRETTSTTLSQLQARKLVRLARRLVTTVRPDILLRAANDKLSRSAPDS